MVIDGSAFTTDLIILPDRILTQWWRREGHLLQIDDLREALQDIPALLIIGTGALGMMKIDPEVQTSMEKLKIRTFFERTKKAVSLFNQWSTRKRTVGAFHLTC
jgi:hypothetical protein